MNTLLAVLIIFLISAIGDVVASKTKAIISSLVFASIIYLVGFWIGLPKTIFADSSMYALGSAFIGILLVHMGTTMSLLEFSKQWKTVIIAAAAVAAVGLTCLLVAGPIIGREYAMAGAPVLSGAIVAALIMSQAAQDAGLPDLAVYVTMVMVLQGFFGYPVASLCLKSEGRRILDDFYKGDAVTVTKIKDDVTKKRLIPTLHENYQTSSIIIAKLAFIAFISMKFSELTDENVNQLIFCLILGVVFKEIGFLEEDALKKANAFGLVISCSTLSIFVNLTNATPTLLKELFLPLLVLIIVGIAGLSFVSIFVGKLLHYSCQMSLAIGVTALFGFPGTFILSNEVAAALADTPEEKQIILDSIMPKMLVAGMVTVSISSVLLAGIMAKMI